MPIEITWILTNYSNNISKSYSGPFSSNFGKDISNLYNQLRTAYEDLQFVNITPDNIEQVPFLWLQHVAPKIFNKIVDKCLYLVKEKTRT